ncbi:hypothetical protein [Providencia rettgeri]
MLTFAVEPIKLEQQTP